MAVLRTTEQDLLAAVLSVLDRAARKNSNVTPLEFRWQVLEAIASRLGGFNYEWYQGISGRSKAHHSESLSVAQSVLEILKSIEIHPTLALASLAQPTLEFAERRKTGSFYTDFRLANFAAAAIPSVRNWRKRILDPACGSGALLAATVLKLAGNDQPLRSRVIGDLICGCDISEHALRAALLVLASLTSDRSAIREVKKRLLRRDSLLLDSKSLHQLAPDGFRAVIMNPPWERLRATRHEFLVSSGVTRHYGHDYGEDNTASEFGKIKENVRNYAAALEKRFDVLGGHEFDSYEAFIALARELLRNGGTLSAFVPSGLIRSLGTTRLRKDLLKESTNLEIKVLDNRAKFFAIDTRFKFVHLVADYSRSNRRHPLVLSHPLGAQYAVVDKSRVPIGRRALETIRHDASIPEVRDNDEWSLFRRISLKNGSFGVLDSWAHSFCREVDMTNDRSLFSRVKLPNSVPLVEGRMVHQFTAAAKSYVAGTGRAAIWVPEKGGKATPQFWFPCTHLRESAAARSRIARAGFCDITGQTNERAMLAAVIPGQSACGNKVPTLQFQTEDANLTSAFAFVGVANTFVFDWLLRRTMTTTVNYFILDAVPFPINSPKTPLALRIAQLSRQISVSLNSASLWDIAELRADLDLLVMQAYGATASDMEVIFRDFPLLDRSEPPLRGELQSTITRDFVLLRAMTTSDEKRGMEIVRRRVADAKRLGAIPYRPSHLVEGNALDTSVGKEEA